MDAWKSLKKNMDVFVCSIPAIRVSELKKKVKRNLALLLQDIQAQGEKPQHYRYLADCYMGLKDYEKSLYYAKRAIAAPVHAMGSDSDMFLP